MQRKTWTSLLAAVALSSVLAGPAAAVTQMVAGWDFSQYSNDGFLSLNGVDLDGGNLLTANFSDLDPTQGAGAESASYGTMYLNGQFGSINTPLDFSDPFVPAASLSISSNADAPAGPDFGSQAAFNVLLNEQGQDFANPFAMTALGAATVVFGATTLNDPTVASASDWVLTFGARVFSTGQASTVGIEFSADGTTFQSFGTANLTGVDTPFSFAFGPSVTEQAFVRLTFSGTSGGAQAYLDNLALTANVTVPEPGTALLLVSGLAGLAVIGGRRN